MLDAKTKNIVVSDVAKAQEYMVFTYVLFKYCFFIFRIVIWKRFVPRDSRVPCFKKKKKKCIIDAI